jgi:excisionase family DNA binding protein
MTQRLAENSPRVEIRWLSVKSAAIYMDCAEDTVRAWVANGLLPCCRIRHRGTSGRGRHICSIRIDKLAIDKWLEGRSR